MRDGHRGPKLIGVSPEFFTWLTDPLNGAGALFDFGCYGADLMTWFMNGKAPESVSAVTLHLQPELYPKVDDESEVVLKYPSAVAILQGSWNWPFDIKDMDVYGRTGYAKTIRSKQIQVRRKGEAEPTTETATPLAAPYDDPLHAHLAAVIHGTIKEDGSLSYSNQYGRHGNSGRRPPFRRNRKGRQATANGLARLILHGRFRAHRNRLNLHAFPRQVAGIQHDGIAVMQTVDHFHSVSIIPANGYFLQMHRVVRAQRPPPASHPSAPSAPRWESPAAGSPARCSMSLAHTCRAAARLP